MGRYYSGDIEGKFMFAVQSSDAPTRFGAQESDPCYIDYYIDYEELENVRKEVESIKEKSKDQLDRISKMFMNEMGYNENTMEKYGVTNHGLSEYADLSLGKQILEFMEENKIGCHINAEL